MVYPRHEGRPFRLLVGGKVQPETVKTPASSTCPRCGSRSVIRSHATLACLPCGHVVEEPAREAWDLGSSLRTGAGRAGPPWTAEERLLWLSEIVPDRPLNLT
jgi:ribosomal protein S27AE